MIIETERLVLRPMEATDVDAMLIVFTDPLICGQGGNDRSRRVAERAGMTRLGELTRCGGISPLRLKSCAEWQRHFEHPVQLEAERFRSHFFVFGNLEFWICYENDPLRAIPTPFTPVGRRESLVIFILHGVRCKRAWQIVSDFRFMRVRYWENGIRKGATHFEYRHGPDQTGGAAEGVM